MSKILVIGNKFLNMDQVDYIVFNFVKGGDSAGVFYLEIKLPDDKATKKHEVKFNVPLTTEIVDKINEKLKSSLIEILLEKPYVSRFEHIKIWEFIKDAVNNGYLDGL